MLCSNKQKLFLQPTVCDFFHCLLPTYLRKQYNTGQPVYIFFANDVNNDVKSHPWSLCQILRLVTIEIVINITYVCMHVTISCQFALSRLGQCFWFLVSVSLTAVVKYSHMTMSSPCHLFFCACIYFCQFVNVRVFCFSNGLCGLVHVVCR